MVNARHIAINDDKDDILAREIIQENTGRKDSELSLISDFINEVEMRLDQVKIFYPIMELFRKRNIQEPFLRLVPELCFLILSYLIYEGKLKHKGIAFEPLEAFLYKALREIYARDFEQKVLRELTIEVLDALQNGGRNFLLNTYSFKTSGFKEKYVKFLEIKQSEDGTLQYYITEQGVDFYLTVNFFHNMKEYRFASDVYSEEISNLNLSRIKSLLAKCRYFQWEDSYENELIIDGKSWRVKASDGDIVKVSTGFNNFPEGFNELLKAAGYQECSGEGAGLCV